MNNRRIITLFNDLIGSRTKRIKYLPINIEDGVTLTGLLTDSIKYPVRLASHTYVIYESGVVDNIVTKVGARPK